MRSELDRPAPALKSEPTAFETWLHRTLQLAYEPVMHEAIPRAILEAMPPPTPQG